jgi:outer membrane protein TolC
MGNLSSIGRVRRARILVGLAASVLLGAGGLAAGEPPAAPAPAPDAVAVAPAPALTLGDCLHAAFERQPTLAALRASLAAAEARAQGVERLWFTGLTSRDLPVRRKQACVSVGIAQAALRQAEADTRYAVTRTYLSAAYARQQLAVADNALTRLRELREATKQLVDSGATNATQRDLERIDVYIPLVQARREEAAQGLPRALAALREAMGVGPDACVAVAAGELPTLGPAVCREEILRLALERRGEVQQAAGAAELTALEVEAQKASLLPTARTFAFAGDIHSQPIPAGIHNTEYRPGAITVEMPAHLVGCRKDRVAQAEALHARGHAVVEKTRNLVALEAEDTYLKGLEAARKLIHYRDAADRARQNVDKLREDLKPNAPTTPEHVLNAGALASELRVRTNEALHQYLLALAALERVTAGGFCAGFEATAP